MFNNFKGLKLQGIATLPAVGAARRPWAQPAQTTGTPTIRTGSSPTRRRPTPPGAGTGARWAGLVLRQLGFASTAAIAELILSPVALVAPDPILFSTVGLSPVTATNPVGTDHTVTAFAQAANGAPVPGVTITSRC